MKNYFIYNASAGAGKTYTLVQNFILKLFTYPNYDGIKYILAVTFTNKAANEMKSRIINQLKEIVENKNPKTQQYVATLKEKSNLSSEQIHNTAQKNLEYILHHYSYFSVSTIDKFNVRLLKSFTKELGLSHSFSVELAEDKIILESIDQLIEGLGEEHQKLLTGVVLDFIETNLEDNQSTYFQGELLKSTQKFLNENNYKHLKTLETFDLEFFADLKKKLLQRISQNSKNVQKISKQAISLCDSYGLSASDFAGGLRNGILQYFLLISQNKKTTITNSVQENINKGKIVSAKCFKSLQSIAENIFPELTTYFYEITNTLQIIDLDKLVVKKLFYLQLQQEIQTSLQKIKTEQDVVLISDFNKIIAQHLQEQPAQFIYEKIGSKIEHYFFDEFQDTSELQWNNFLPLVEEAISSPEQTLTLVGDPKQSIYRFRAGKPEIMLNLMKQAEVHKQMLVIPLENNFRSKQNIVKFNNLLYKNYAHHFVEGEFQELFSHYSHQEPKGKEGGTVEIFLAPKEESTPIISEQILKIIQDCDQRGYKRSDIAVLVRKKRFIQNFVDLFAENQIDMITEEAISLEQSAVAQSLVLFLQWENQPKDLYLFVQFLLYITDLKLSKPENQHDIIQKFTISNEEPLLFLQKNFDVSLQNLEKHSISFSNYVENYFQELQLSNKHETEMIAILDMLYELEAKKAITSTEFLSYWEEKGKKTGIVFPENENAIRVMTVHKSKGLEFPVVIYPTYKSGNNNSKEYWLPLEEKKFEGLPKFYSESLPENTKDEQYISLKENQTKLDNIDEICVHYVATTRAVDALYILDVKFEEDKNVSQSNTDSLFNKIVRENFSETHRQSENDRFTFHTDPYDNEIMDKENPNEQTTVIQWISNNSFNSLQISTDSLSQLKREKQQIYGELLHKLLAEVATEENISSIMKKVVQEGFIPKEDADSHEKIIREIIKQPILKPFFSSEATLYTERDFMIDGNVFRPDRIVLYKNNYYLLDYKTGFHQEKYIEQITSYKKALKNLNYPIEKAYLVYINNDISVVEI